MKLSNIITILSLTILLGIQITKAERCGSQAGGAVCPNGQCCSKFGLCGTTTTHCTTGCQSQCRPSGGGSTSTDHPSGNNGGGDISNLVSASLFEQMLKHRNDGACKGRGFYTYNAFIAAARSFNGFGTSGDVTARKREIAAFFGQTSHETTGGWESAQDGPYAWGYCLVREINQDVYCSSNQFSCAPGRKYYGRGPIQLTHNYNYAQAGKAIGVDLINNPDLVATDPVVSFKTAIWFWMTAQGNKPSSHDVITSRWLPSSADRAAGRFPGYGVITNIINGGVECGHGLDSRVGDRIGFYKRYCDILGVRYGWNLNCHYQRPFA